MHYNLAILCIRFPVYIVQTYRKVTDRICEHQKTSKSQDMSAKIHQHSFDLDHIPDYSNCKIRISN